MAQGWAINSATDPYSIRFNEPPSVGANNVVVTQVPSSGVGGTDVWSIGAWSNAAGYPAVVQFFSDRLWFAASPSDPQTIWASNTGDYTNFGRSSPIVDSDALTFAINARHVNVIRDLLPLDNLLALTTGGEYKLTGGSDEVVTPSTIGAKPQGNAGIADLPAEVIGDSAIFIQAEGQKIRDMRYQFEKDGFRGDDISVWADHLFAGRTIKSLAYWKAPWQVIWFNRDDGVRIGCTYMPEQEVLGWHRHDTDGEYLDSCSLPGTTESDCYHLVRRFINGEWVQCVEQQAPILAPTESDLFFVDCGLKYNGRNDTNTTVTVTTGAGWTESDELTITASDPIFLGASDVGDAFELWRMVDTVDDEGKTKRERAKVQLVIDAYDSATSVRARSIGTVPAQLRAVALPTWTLQRDTIDSLWHLEGKAVSVLQDGAVSGPFTVQSGKVALQTPGGVVNIGLPYTAEIETLELNDPGGESMRDKNKLAYRVDILLLASRGVYSGGVRGPLYPVKDRSYENYGQPPFLKTGVVDVDIPAGWANDAGRVRIVSEQPLPMEILSITTRAIASNGQNGGASR